MQTCSSFPFRDFPRSCWSDFCGKGASWTPHNHLLGASEYFPDKTAVRSVWMCSSLWRMSNAMATLCSWDSLLPSLMYSVVWTGVVGFFLIRYHSFRLSHAPHLLEKHHQCGHIQHDGSKKKPHNCSRQLQWWLSGSKQFSDSDLKTFSNSLSNKTKQCFIIHGH